MKLKPIKKQTNSIIKKKAQTKEAQIKKELTPVGPENQTFVDNWCMLMVWVGMYSGKYLPIANGIWSFIHLVFLMITVYHSLRVDFDVDLFSASIDYSLMLCSAYFSMLNCQYYRSCIDKMIRVIEMNFHDYMDTVDPETAEEVQKYRDAIKGRKERVSKVCLSIFGGTGLTTMVVLPFFFPDPNLDKDDAINRNIPVSVYYPFKTNTWFKWTVAVLAEYWIVYIIIAVVSGTDIPFACFTEEGILQLKRLALSLRHSQRRARYVYKKQYGREVKDYSDPRYIECLKTCMNHSVKHHYTIIKFFQEIKTHYFYILLIIMLGSTFLLCLTGILSMAENVNIGAKLKFLVMLLCILFHTLTFNWYGELVSQTVRDVLYEAEWLESSRELLPYMIIMMTYLNKPITLDVGGFMTCNLNTYGNVLSSAYSYFNLLKVMMGRGELRSK